MLLSTVRRARRALPACLTLFLFVPMAGAQALPELPRVSVDTSWVAPTGTTIAVPAGGDFQAALNSAQPGDVITLQAGATYVGTFTLPVKSGSGWILVRSSAPDSSLPAQGTRIGPAYAAAMPKIVTTNAMPALDTAPGAHHFRFMGVEFAQAAGTGATYDLVRLGDGSPAQSSLSDAPHHLILDRCYVHGIPTANLRRGVALNSATTAVIDSYVSDVHEVGADSQAIGGWNGPGPYKIVNNTLEGAGENVLFGGADASIPNLTPSDIEVRGNLMRKPLSWRVGDPSYAGIHWTVKNLFELKNAQRVLAEGNIFENNWLDAQNGFAILFTVRNQDGTNPWAVVQDVTFRKNIVRHTAAAVNVLGMDNAFPSQTTRRVLIQDVLFEDIDGPKWGGSGRLFQLLDGTSDVTIDHVTGFQTGEVIVASGPANSGFTYRNTISAHNEYGVGGDGTFGNPTATLGTYFPGAVFARNILMGGNEANYPPDNFFPASWAAVGFVDIAGGNYRLSASSPYNNAGTDAKDLGADMDAIAAATAGGGGGGTPPPGDTTPPVISGVVALSIASTSVVINWQTNEASDSQVEFGTTTSYGHLSPLNVSLLTAHSQAIGGLGAGTLYHYRVRSRDAAGNLAVSGDFTFTTAQAGDTTPPTVTLTAPGSGATVSGVIGVTANAADYVGVAGVQFRVDGANIGAEDTTAPYSVSWDTRPVADGSHTLAAVARDAAGNIMSAAIAVTVANGGSPPPGGGVSWTQLVNAAANGSLLQKSGGCDGCQDSGAISVQTIASGNGFMEVAASETTTQRVIGLSSGNTDTTSADIDFALLFWPGGTVDVRENGVYRGAETSYATGNVFRIAVESGVVKYYKNGAVFYTSGVAPSYPLLVDTSLFNAGASFGTVTLSTAGGGQTGSQTPYSGQPITIPAEFQAEDFDTGGEGVAYHDLVAGNQGAAYRTGEDVDIVAVGSSRVVNNIQTGEWLEYTVTLSKSGSYRLETLASSALNGGRWHIEVDGVNVTGPVTVPNTGSWYTFQWVGKSGISLTAGQHVIRILAEAEYFNLDSLRVAARSPSRK